MARTLQQLKLFVEKMIEEQGPDAPVASFVYTQNDVTTFDQETFEEQYLPMDIVTQVLEEIDSMDYINEQVYECIDDVIRRVNK